MTATRASLDTPPMDVTIVGTGNMARAIATRALAGGHHVTLVGTHLSKADGGDSTFFKLVHR